MKLYLTAGHTINHKAKPPKGTGVFGYKGFDEAVEARILVHDVINYMLYNNDVNEFDVLTDHDGWGLGAVIDWIGKKVTKNCLTVDVHFNAFNSKAYGTEVLIPDKNTDEEYEIADYLSLGISIVLNTRNRGVKTESDSHRGYLGMLSNSKLAHAKNILIEVMFCDKKEDVEVYRKYYPELVFYLADYFTEILKEHNG